MKQNTIMIAIIATLAIVASFILTSEEIGIALVMTVIALGAGFAIPSSSNWVGFMTRFFLALFLFAVVFGFSFALRFMREGDSVMQMFSLTFFVGAFLGFFGIILGSLFKNVYVMIRKPIPKL